VAGDPRPGVEQLTGDPVVDEATTFFNHVAEYEADWRTRFIEDIRFENGDSTNYYQWPDQLRNARSADNKPCLTMNMIRQHNLLISNQLRKNKSSPKVIAMGGQATQESASMMKALIRHIEYQSDAQDAYTVGRSFQIGGGIGWVRLVTDWVPGTFEQEIYIRPILDPLTVFIDPNCRQKFTKSDAKRAIVFDTLPVDEFLEAFPEAEDCVGLQPLGVGTTDGDLISKDQVRVAEYFRRVTRRDRLISFVHEGKRRSIRESMLSGQIGRMILDDPLTKTRTVMDEVVEWKLIAGSRVIDETVWPGEWIPLIPFLGEETVIDGRLDRKGHTRAMKDAQRMYNYAASASVEVVATQTKTPWVASARAIEGHEVQWNSANTQNASVLVWNDVDEDNPDTKIDKPERIPPPVASQGFETAMVTAQQQMMLTSGQYQNALGQLGNERTGKAITARQEQSDTQVFHFQDNYESGLKFLCKQIIGVIPKVYDTQRVVKIQAEDGTDLEIEIDPGARLAYLQEIGHQGEVARRIFNPALGRYDIAADVGPAYTSRRQETLDALTLILTQAPGLVGIIGDLLFKNLEFDDAMEAAQRLRRMVPPEALGQGPTPAEQQLQAQVAALGGQLTKLYETAGKDKIKLIGKDQMREIDVYKAETDRMKALADVLPMDQPGLEQLVGQLVQEALKTSLVPILKENLGNDEGSVTGDLPQAEAEAPPIPGARRAPDNNWYLADPTRTGKYLRVGPLAQQRGTPQRET